MINKEESAGKTNFEIVRIKHNYELANKVLRGIESLRVDTNARIYKLNDDSKEGNE